MYVPFPWILHPKKMSNKDLSHHHHNARKVKKTIELDAHMRVQNKVQYADEKLENTVFKLDQLDCSTRDWPLIEN